MMATFIIRPTMVFSICVSLMIRLDVGVVGVLSEVFLSQTLLLEVVGNR